MTKLVLELQRDAMAENCSVSELLRKAMVVAKKLRIADFELWVSHELNGYPPDAEMPKYREVVGNVEAWSPYNGWIPIFIEDDDLARTYSRRMMRQSIGSMEPLVSERNGQVLEVSYPPAIKNQLMQSMETPLEPTLHIGSNQVNGILQIVRNTVLNWSLELESRGILGEDMSFTPEEKQAAKEMQTITIESF